MTCPIYGMNNPKEYMEQKPDNAGMTVKKRILGIVISVSASLLFLALQVWLFNDQGMYLLRVRNFLKELNRFTNAEANRWCSVCAYLSTLTPVLFAYYMTVLRPRHRAGNPYWTGKRITAAFIVILIASVLGLLSVTRIYNVVIPKAGVVTSAAWQAYNTVFFLNAAVAAAGLIWIFLSEEMPPFVKRGKQYFAGKEFGGSLLRYVLVVTVGFLGIIVCGLILNVIGVFYPELSGSTANMFMKDLPLVSGVITMTICAPLVEELMFRGLVFGKCRNYMPVWTAVLFSAVCFGIWHRNLGQFCYTVPMGILFACVYQKTGRLRYSILLHCVNNLLNEMSMVTAYNRDRAVLPWVPGLNQLREWILGLSGPVSAVLFVMVIVFMVFIIWKVIPKVPETAVENS